MSVEIKDSVNPIGNVVADEGLLLFIKTMQELWEQTREKPGWWMFWKRASLVSVTNFLMKCLDDLIAYVDGVVDNGADKKATVLWAISQIYDYIIREAIPIWLRPFGSQVRNYIINTLISSSIDWIVEKYRNGDWRKKPQEEVVAQWTQLHMQLFGVPGGHRPK